jgi:hypothetical protein
METETIRQMGLPLTAENYLNTYYGYEVPEEISAEALSDMPSWVITELMNEPEKGNTAALIDKLRSYGTL